MMTCYDCGFSFPGPEFFEEVRCPDCGSLDIVAAADIVVDEDDEIDDMSSDDFEDDMSAVEADADTFKSIGWGTDEDYGYFGDEY